MAELTEDRLREIVREELAPKPQFKPIPLTPQSEAQQLAASTAPSADASAYNLSWHSRAHDIEDPNAFALDTSLRNFAKDVGLPAHVGGSVLAQAIDDVRRWENMTPADQEDYTRSQHAILARVFPGQTAEQVIAKAETVLKRADPQFVASGRQNGLFVSANIIAQLAVQADRDALRSAR